MVSNRVSSTSSSLDEEHDGVNSTLDETDDEEDNVVLEISADKR